jgi:hypothetical protein
MEPSCGRKYEAAYRLGHKHVQFPGFFLHAMGGRKSIIDREGTEIKYV